MTNTLPLKNIWLLAVVVSSLLMIMPLLNEFAPDAVAHMNALDCFVNQFWSGDVYPRWCYEMNTGLGAAVFLSYYPFSYFISALLMPFNWLNFSGTQMYFFALWFCNIITYVTAWYWLRDVAGDKRAALAAMVYLVIAYRLEVFISRSSFPETWLMAWLPLLLLFTRRLVLGQSGATLRLAFIMAVCLLTQVPTTINTLLICGIYVLLMAWGKWVVYLRLGLSTIFAVLITAFYFAPAMYYAKFFMDMSDGHLKAVWVNRHMMLDDFFDKGFLLLNLCVVVLITVFIVTKFLHKKNKIVDVFINKEIQVVAFCSLLAFLLLLPVGIPFWDSLRMLGIPAFAWRMQAFISLACVYLIAVYMRYLVTEKQQKTWRFDYAVFLAFLYFLSITLYPLYTDDDAKDRNILLQGKIHHFEDFFPKWITEDYKDTRKLMERYQSKKGDEPLVFIASGKGKISDAVWSNGEIHFSARSDKPVTVVADHYYFPIWKAKDAAGIDIITEPDKNSGRLGLSLPAGEHRVTIYPEIYKGNLLLEWCRQISFAALLIWLGLYWRFRRANASTT
jgi:hypothetical protein